MSRAAAIGADRRGALPGARARFAACACRCLLIATIALPTGCAKVDNLWPFGGPREQANAHVPANATAYHCDGGRRFYVRYLEGGASAWVILPDREFRLNRTSNAATRYSNGVSTLDIGGEHTVLSDGAGLSFTGCKPAA